jgi:hypothetical protein
MQFSCLGAEWRGGYLYTEGVSKPRVLSLTRHPLLRILDKELPAKLKFNSALRKWDYNRNITHMTVVRTGNEFYMFLSSLDIEVTRMRHGYLENIPRKTLHQRKT